MRKAKRPESRKRSPLKIAGLALGGVAGACLLLVLGLGLFIGTPYFAAKLGSVLTNQSGRNIALEGEVDAHLWSRTPRLVLRGVKVGNAEWAESPYLFEAREVDVTIRLLPLLRLRVELPEVKLDKPKLMLERNKDGEANWTFTQNPQAAALKQPVPEDRGSIPLIGELIITEGELGYKDPARGIDTALNVSTVTGQADRQDLHVEGDGTYQGAPFKLSLSGASALQLREADKPYPFRLETTIGDTGANVEGTVKDPVTMEQLDVRLELKGADMADLFPITGIALPPSPPYNIAGNLTHDESAWHFDQIKGTMGKSDIGGHITWQPQRERPYFSGELVSKNLDMTDLKGFVGAHKEPSDPDRVIPDAPLDVTRLMAMDADVTFRGEHIKTPQLLDNFLMTVDLKNGVLVLDPLSFGIAKGKIESRVKVRGHENPPAADLDVHFERLALESLFAGLAKAFGEENVAAGRIGGKAELHGYGKSLHTILASSNGDIAFGMEGGRLSQLLLHLVGLDLFKAAGLLLSGDQPAPIRCIIADFHAQDGMMRTQEFLIDTEVSVIDGNGTVNLDNERLDLELRTYPKEPSLLSLRSPIRLGGTLKNINYGIDPAALVVRGGAAALLAAAAPPAALLAFVGPGLGEDSNCAALLKQIPADAREKNTNAGK